jgi:nucleoside-diphosphate-sugar epimerase
MNNTYSISKTTVERFIQMYNKERGTRINIVRAMNAYGPGQSVAAPYGSSKVRKITPSFICRALHGDPIELYGGGHQTSDMVYVEDVAEALIRALDRAIQGDLFTVEIGPEKHNTVREVAQMVLELTGSSSKLVDLPMRPGEIEGAKVTADISTLAHINMKPSELVDLETGLTQTIEYFKNDMALGSR